MRKATHPSMRHFLIWCLALLLPLQGLAASAGLHCVAMAAVVVVSENSAHPCHGTGAAAEGAAAHHASTASPDLPLPAPADDQTAAGHTCSACAACCVAAALPSHSRWTAAAVMAETMSVLPLPHRAGVTTAGLDRPPKAFIV